MNDIMQWFSSPLGLTVGILVAIVVLLAYFIPTIVAFKNRQAHKAAIFFLNLFLGWNLIGWIVALVWALKKEEVAETDLDIQRESAPVTASGYTSSSSETSSSTTKIFVNGGAPASGNTIGRIFVDDKVLTLFFTDAPVEIAVRPGMHHIVIEGGLSGDARVDRNIDFGYSDVLTVDMPGMGDEDLIRFQMISYSEYRRALRDCNFKVTYKSL